MLEDETEQDGFAPESDLPKPPMHYLIEIQLMTNQIVGASNAENRNNSDWMVKQQHVRRYLMNYYREHAVLPTGRRYLGMTRPRNLEIGMVDLGAIRQRIRVASEEWNGLNVESLQADDEPVTAGVDAETRVQAAAGVEETIFDLRQELTRRGRKI